MVNNRSLSLNCCRKHTWKQHFLFFFLSCLHVRMHKWDRWHSIFVWKTNIAASQRWDFSLVERGGPVNLLVWCNPYVSHMNFVYSDIVLTDPRRLRCLKNIKIFDFFFSWNVFPPKFSLFFSRSFLLATMAFNMSYCTCKMKLYLLSKDETGLMHYNYNIFILQWV